MCYIYHNFDFDVGKILTDKDYNGNRYAIGRFPLQIWLCYTEVETDSLPKGLNEDVVRAISAKKNEPEFMLEFRLKAYRKWLELQEPRWVNVDYPEIDYQNISYYSAPKTKPSLNSLDEVDPEVLRTFEKLGIPLDEQKRLSNVAVDMVFDSVSIGTTF